MLKILNEESGIVLIISLLVLLALTTLGIVAINNSSTSLEISGNLNGITESFLLAEAGISQAGQSIDLSKWDSYTIQKIIVPVTTLSLGSFSATIEWAGGQRKRLTATGESNLGGIAQVEVILEPVYTVYPFDTGITTCTDISTGSSGYSQSCDLLDIVNIFINKAIPIKTSNNNMDLPPGNFFDYDFSLLGAYDLGEAGQDKTYYFDNFNIGTGADITIKGDVAIYIEGNFNMQTGSNIILSGDSTLTIYNRGIFQSDSNTSINAGGDPADLIIYSDADSSADPSKTIDIRSSFAGLIYAPKTDIKIDVNGRVDGAIIGNRVESGPNVEFYYDKTLKTKPFEGSAVTGFKKILWRSF
ncbi:MAG: hypothetical protein V1872_07045 [bacterium]